MVVIMHSFMCRVDTLLIYRDVIMCKDHIVPIMLRRFGIIWIVASWPILVQGLFTVVHVCMFVSQGVVYCYSTRNEYIQCNVY